MFKSTDIIKSIMNVYTEKRYCSKTIIDSKTFIVLQKISI